MGFVVLGKEFKCDVAGIAIAIQNRFEIRFVPNDIHCNLGSASIKGIPRDAGHTRCQDNGCEVLCPQECVITYGGNPIRDN